MHHFSAAAAMIQSTSNVFSLNPKVAFIFDMDGVIVDSNPFHKTALKQFCRKYGKDLTEDELREKIYGRRNEDWLVNVFGKLDPAENVCLCR